ncbi:MAG: hypothetical protein PHE68_01200 [Candidatus Peribacteraceae bacterium]|nr:hypothetical protein [Candidatus Peribacteraceae bacterium]MDD5074406.1 hypothetical protein [Candidatus Peribacteraceae bacterium]
MKNFHLSSFILGLISGALVLFLIVGGKQLLWPSQTVTTNAGTWQQQQGNSGQNTARMAQRLGMTQDELQKALASGKTIQEIAKEKRIELPAGGFGQRNGTASGGTLPRSSSGSSFSSATSSTQASSVHP